jgi:hypothetical protein
VSAGRCVQLSQCATSANCVCVLWCACVLCRVLFFWFFIVICFVFFVVYCALSKCVWCVRADEDAFCAQTFRNRPMSSGSRWPLIHGSSEVQRSSRAIVQNTVHDGACMLSCVVYGMADHTYDIPACDSCMQNILLVYETALRKSQVKVWLFRELAAGVFSLKVSNAKAVLAHLTSKRTGREEVRNCMR